MAMRMLDAAGVPIVSDGARTADDSNPRGYYEYERVKELDKGLDTSWLEDARGKAIKIISFLLRDLPETNNYRVIFMQRNMAELIASQNTMLAARGEVPDSTGDERIAARYQEHLSDVRRLLERQPCFAVLDVDYGAVVEKPLHQAERIARFLGGSFDAAKMAAGVDAALYRNRA